MIKQLFHTAVVTTLVTLLPLPVSAEEVLLDKIAAVVNNDVVMASELEARVRDIYVRLEETGTEAPPQNTLVPQVLERLILERLQLSLGQRAGVRYSDAELNQAMARLAKGKGTTVDGLVEAAHKRGITLAGLRKQIREEMIISKVQEGSVNRRINITEQEIDNFLNSAEGKNWSSPDVNLGHILVPLSSGAPREEVASVEEKIRDLYNQIQSGADFKNLAVANSSGQNALQGGDLGWRKTAQLPSLFITAIENLDPGQTSEPIRSNAGYHLLKLYERRGGSGKRIVQQHNVRHILLIPNEVRSDEETKAELIAIRDQIRSNEDFEALAKKQSEDIASAMGGGELGWSVPGKFVPAFEKTMNELDVDQISEPIRTQFGWHILQVTERRQQDFSEDIKRSQAHQILKRRKFDEELQVWLQEIRDEAFVDIKL